MIENCDIRRKSSIKKCLLHELHGYDTKDGWSVVVGGLEEGFACPSPTRGLRTVVYGFRFPMVGAGLESGCWMVGEMVLKRLWLRAGWSCPHRGWEMVV